MAWAPKDYTPFFLMDEPTHTPQEIRAEYSRVRDIAMKRAARLDVRGVTAQASYLREIFPKLKDINSADVSKTLSRAMSFLNDRAYSLKGLREIQARINTETGEIVPLGDVLSFTEFMKSWRLSAFSKLMVPSGEAAALHGTEEYNEIGGSFSDFYVLYQQM